MKHLILLLFLLTTISNSFCQVTLSKDSLRKMAIGTWQVERITVNGKEDLENYPVKDDILVLNTDSTYLMTDHMYNYDQRGAWSIDSENRIALNDEELKEKYYLKIISLTAQTLIVNPQVEGRDEIVISFIRKK